MSAPSLSAATTNRRPPLERLLSCPDADPVKTQELKRLRDTTDPFELAKRMEQKLERIFEMANQHISPQPKDPNIQSPTRSEKQTLSEIAKIFATQLQK